MLVLYVTVTLLGGHSLGHMHKEVSGYGFTDATADPTILNAWDSTPAVLDNDYYIKLTDIVSTVSVSRVWCCRTTNASHICTTIS